MPISQPLQREMQSSVANPVAENAQAVYGALMKDPACLTSQRMGLSFLKQQLKRAALLSSTLPQQPEAVVSWVERQAIAVGEQYAVYLESRKAGQPRRYFTCRAHALWFLQRAAPTKLVDGAWLYGTLHYWQDNRLYPLLRTYLEELGDGDAAQNHVLLYQRLLAEHSCDTLPNLSDEHYTQGAVQLALGYHADDFLPELIGFNLGYEQMPLHLLITAFELNELQIDPYYFTLHITIDNASTGHAHKAAKSLLDIMPVTGDRTVFWQRVTNGYRLNQVGLSSTAIIEAFDLEQELVDMLGRKAVFGHHMHSDFCCIDGRTVNEWLENPRQIRAFLHALVNGGWIKRDENPQVSRFWRLIEGPGAQMFGVFSPYEKQLLHDWIAGEWLGDSTHSSVSQSQTNSKAGTKKNTGKIAQRRTFRRYRPAPIGRQSGSGLDTASASASNDQHESPGDIDFDVRELVDELECLADDQRMQRLIQLMSPSHHATAAGLLATRLFSAAIR